MWVYVTLFCSPIHHAHTCLQVVQRSLSGGYLTEDEALLNANARGKLYEALATTSGVRAATDESPTAQGGPTQPQERSEIRSRL